MTNEQLKTLRKTLNLTQKQIADELGISKRMYEYLEAGQYNIRPQTIKLIVALFPAEYWHVINP